ncbi:MAG: glycosyltransferase family 39 protein [Patescibacteria group bacterium]
MNLIKKYKYLVVIFFIAVTIRFYGISTVPPGLYSDEAAIGYNAYSVLKTGRDEYGQLLPLTFRSFDDYKTPLYIYLTVPLVYLFGLNEFSVRALSALSGSLATITIYFISLRIFSKKKLALLTGLFLAISPLGIVFSRGAFEANLMLFLVSVYLLISLKETLSLKSLATLAVVSGLSIYSYHSAKLITPLFLLAFILTRQDELKTFGKRLIIPMFIFILLMLPIATNFNDFFTRGKAVSILSSKNIPDQFVQNYLSYFSPKFLFAIGDSIGRHSVSNHGQLYLFELPLILVAIATLKISKKTSLFIFLLLISPIPASVAQPNPHALRAISLSLIFAILSGYGLSKVLEKSKKQALLMGTASTLVVFYFFISFLHLYFVHNPKEKGPDWGDGYKQALEYVNSHQKDYTKVAFSDYFGQAYIYALFYSKYDPLTYQKKQDYKHQFSKFEFFGESWNKTSAGKALVVSPFWQQYPGNKLENIYNKKGDLVFVISESE